MLCYGSCAKRNWILTNLQKKRRNTYSRKDESSVILENFFSLITQRTKEKAPVVESCSLGSINPKLLKHFLISGCYSLFFFIFLLVPLNLQNFLFPSCQSGSCQQDSNEYSPETSLLEVAFISYGFGSHKWVFFFFFPSGSSLKSHIYFKLQELVSVNFLHTMLYNQLECDKNFTLTLKI